MRPTTEPVSVVGLTTALPRFATHVELHRGLTLSRSGDKAGRVAYATASMDTLPPKGTAGTA
ncbi:hypothetical protein [Streptomyces subrutilus]|uniref:hypothetical protein n=1 Tax=Streptomyces subrutilus TaxID=36818 RepID=UPI00142F95C4|nr:hypothetical protein [Streptomyces subrutilus]